MKVRVISQSIIVAALFCLSAPVFAAPTWKIIPADSSLTFTATQNNAPITGSFKKFTGNIQFDPADLKSSRVEIDVDIASVTAGDSQVADTLKTKDWFNVTVFPHAVFKATDFVKTGDKKYEAKGVLTIRAKTIPMVLVFNLDDYAANKAHATGSTTLQRTQFGVGQGDWSKTDAIKDDVRVDFIISATK